MKAIIHKKKTTPLLYKEVIHEGQEKTALELREYYTVSTTAQTINAAPSEINTKPPDTIDIYCNIDHSILQIRGMTGVAKIYNKKGKLILIGTAVNNMKEFNISHLKKGNYIIEANRIFFEFVK